MFFFSEAKDFLKLNIVFCLRGNGRFQSETARDRNFESRVNKKWFGE